VARNNEGASIRKLKPHLLECTTGSRGEVQEERKRVISRGDSDDSDDDNN